MKNIMAQAEALFKHATANLAYMKTVGVKNQVFLILY